MHMESGGVQAFVLTLGYSRQRQCYYYISMMFHGRAVMYHKFSQTAATPHLQGPLLWPNLHAYVMPQTRLQPHRCALFAPCCLQPPGLCAQVAACNAIAGFGGGSTTPASAYRKLERWLGACRVQVQQLFDHDSQPRLLCSPRFFQSSCGAAAPTLLIWSDVCPGTQTAPVSGGRSSPRGRNIGCPSPHDPMHPLNYELRAQLVDTTSRSTAEGPACRGGTTADPVRGYMFRLGCPGKSCTWSRSYRAARP